MSGSLHSVSAKVKSNDVTKELLFLIRNAIRVRESIVIFQTADVLQWRAFTPRNQHLVVNFNLSCHLEYNLKWKKVDKAPNDSTLIG